MKFVYCKFYDLCYSDGWQDEELDIEDTIHTGIGVLMEDKDTHILLCMFLGNNLDQPFAKLMIPKPMIINYVTIDEHSFTDRLLTNGYGDFTENGEIKENEKTVNRDYKSIELQQGEDDNSESTKGSTAAPHTRV